MKRQFYVYILANRLRGVLYIGVTTNLARRMTEHRAKVTEGFTAAHGVIQLVHVELFESMLEARTRERALKRWRRSWKFELIEASNPTWRDLANEIAF